MNKFNLVLSGLMFAVSLFHSVSSGLKYGLSYEVQTIVNGVVETSMQNTILNVFLAGMFGFMFLSSMFTVVFIGFVDIILRRKKGIEKE